MICKGFLLVYGKKSQRVFRQDCAFLKSREYVSSKDRSCAGPIGHTQALQSDSPEPLPCPLETPEVAGAGGCLWSPVPIGAGLDFHHGFPLLGTFYGVPMMSNRACDHRDILGSCAP